MRKINGRRGGLRVLVTTVLLILGASLVGAPPASSVTYLSPTSFSPYTYAPLPGVSFSTQLPTAVAAAEACAYLPIDFQHSNVEAANNLSVSVEIWNAGGVKLASATIRKSGGWNPTGGVTRMELFDCTWNPGSYSLIVYANYGSSTLVKQTQVSLTVTRPAPVVSAISPTSGPAAGGTAVVLTGSGFKGATGVTFGGVAATSMSIIGDTQISVVAPSHAAGAVDVVVAGQGGPGTLSAGFTYIAPDATSLSLAAAPKKVKKGKKVTLRGVLRIPSKGLSLRRAPIGLWVSTGGGFKSIGTVTTDDSGNFVKSVRVKRLSTFKATFAGTSDFAPSESRGAKVKVR